MDPASSVPVEAQAPSEADRNSLLIAYICYACAAVGFVIGPFVGVIINHLKADATRGSYLGSHHRWLLRTFWFSLLWYSLSGVAAATLILIPLAWLGTVVTTIWYVYRIVRGAISFADRKAL